MKPSYTYKKGEGYQINQYLNSSEIDCKCQWLDCFSTTITAETIDSFYKTRDEYGKIINISSGNRCQRRNKIIPNAVENSNHLCGDALDLVPFVVNNLELEILEQIARKYFKFVMRGQGYIHADNRLNKE